MHLRTARRGRNAGGRIWGCTSFPRCRGIVNVEENSVGDGDHDGSTVAAPPDETRSAATLTIPAKSFWRHPQVRSAPVFMKPPLYQIARLRRDCAYSNTPR